MWFERICNACVSVHVHTLWHAYAYIGARSKDQNSIGRPFLKDGIFYRLLSAVLLEMHGKYDRSK